MTRSRLVVAAGILGPLLWLFGPVLFGGKTFLFRDAAHYYYPLFQWTCREWSGGRVPLWNPQQNCGVPAVGDTTSSIFYPGKLIFLLPGVDFATRYSWYITGHVLLAAVGAYGLAREYGASVLAAGLCAVSYAFGGNVLFQYCNVVFLVGAAWLPLALLAADRALTRRSVFWSVIFGAALATMTLGGDPQAAYHAGLLAGLLAVVLRRFRRRAGAGQAEPDSADHPGPGSERWWSRFRRHHATLLAAAAATGAVLAAVQILPAIQWTSRSDRAAFDVPRSLYEVPPLLARRSGGRAAPDWPSVVRGLFGKPPRGTHQHHIYDFSVAPWRIAEMVWPNCSGRMFPTNRRWTRVIPAAGRIWTPSLYMGFLPFVLALSSWRLRGGSARQCWLSWMVLLAAAGSLGWYGLGWLIQELRCGLLGADPNQVLLGEPVGGVYWLLVLLLPGYAYFRFPAKLLVVAALGLSLLAAHGWDRALDAKRSRLRGILATAAIVSMTCVGVLSLAPSCWWDDCLSGVRADAVFGPLDRAGALADLAGGFLQTAIVSLVLVVLLRVPERRGARIVPAVALLVTCADLSIAHRWMIPAAPREMWRGDSPVVRLISEDEAAHGVSALHRLYRGSLERWVPRDWQRRSSPGRQEEVLAWDRATLFPLFHLPAGQAVVEAYGTMTSQDFLAFLQVAKQAGPRRTDGVREPCPNVLSALSARYLLLPSGVSYPGAERVAPSGLPNRRWPKEAVLWRSNNCLPRAWIVHQVEAMPALRSRRPAAILRRTEQVLFAGNQPRDLRRWAVVESDHWRPPRLPDRREMAGRESCRIVAAGPQRVELQVGLRAGGLVVLSDLYYPGWIAEVVTEGDDSARREPILRTNRIMRGLYLPAGRHRIVYRYQPRSFQIGAAASAIGWSLLAVLALLVWRKRRATGPSPPIADRDRE